MKRALVFVAFFIAALLVLSVSSYAAGVSTSTTSSPQTAKTATSVKADTQAKAAMKSRISDKLDSARTRYLSAKAKTSKPSYSSVSANAVAEGLTDESCLGLSENRQASCRALYRDSGSCYEREGRQRAACLRESAGFGAKTDVADVSKDTRKRYAVLLLYHLQDKVERKFFEGEITREEASEWITQIVSIKQMILEDKPKEEIKAEIKALRESWKE